jgi:uncharacterized protein YggU (UPF0235/DUF167 family)
MADQLNWKHNIGDKFEVRVNPKSSFNTIKVEEDEQGFRIKIYVTAAPEDNKANEAVLRLLAKELGIPKTSLSIVQGLHSRTKVIQRHSH